MKPRLLKQNLQNESEEARQVSSD